MGIGLHRAGMQQVEAADIEGGGDGVLGAAGDQPLGEMHAAVAVIEGAVDMGRGDGDQPRRTQQAPHLGEDAQGHGGAFAPVAGGGRALLPRELKAH
jgi:hypothetical protein